MLNEDLAVQILQLQEYQNEEEDPALRYLLDTLASPLFLPI